MLNLDTTRTTTTDTRTESALIVAALAARIDTEPSPAARVLAWASVGHAIALADVLRGDPTHPSPATWVEPQLAWAIDALAEAGVPAVATASMATRIIAADDDVAATVMVAALETAHAAAITPAPMPEPDSHAKARAYAANRTGAALRALARVAS